MSLSLVILTQIPADLQGTYDKMSFMEKSLVDSYMTVTSGLDYSKDLLMISSYETQIMSNIWNFLLPLSISLVVLYIVMNIVNDASSRFKEIDYKYIFILLVKIIIAETILYFGPHIITGICNVGNWALQHFIDNPIAATTATEDSEKYVRALINTVDKMNMIALFGAFLYGFLLNGMNLIPNAMISLHAISRKIELVLRGGCACIALPDIFQEGMRSNGIRYIKRFAVVALHGFIMLITVQIAGSLARAATLEAMVSSNNTINLTSLGNFISAVMYNFAAVGIISSSKAILNDMLGA